MSPAAERKRVPSDGEAILNALPNPVLLIGPDGKIVDANNAAESFFEISTQFLQRQSLKELVPFGSPLLSLIDQVRASGSPVNEYKVDLGTPRLGGDRLVDQRQQRTAERHELLQELTLQELRRHVEEGLCGHVGVDDFAVGGNQDDRIRQSVEDGIAIRRLYLAVLRGRRHAVPLHAKSSKASQSA